MPIREQSWGGRLGTALGGALGSGIEALAEHKMNQLSRRSIAAEFEAANFSPEESRILARFGPRERELILRNTRQINQQGEQQSPEQQSNFQQLFGQQQEPQQNIAQLMQGLGGQRPALSSNEFLDRLMASQQSPRQQFQQQQQAPPTQTQNQIAPQQQQAMQQAQPVQPEVKQAPRAKLTALGRLAAGQVGTPAQQLAAQKRIDTANAPFVKTVKTNLPVAEKQIELATELLDLINSGQVASGWKGFALSKTGLTPGMNKATQRANTIMNDLASQEAKGMGQITNAKLRLAQGVKPSLEKDTDVQREETERILRRAQKFVEMNSLIDELSEGGQPENLQKLVSQRMKSEDLPEGAREGDVYEDDSGQRWTVRNGVLERAR